MVHEILLTKQECDWIISLADDYVRSGITNDGKTIEVTNYRTCYEYTLENHQELYDLILDKIKKYRIVSLPSEMTIIRYEPGQYFKPHIDRALGFHFRYRTVTIQLSDESEYNGGDLIIYMKDKDGITYGDAISRKLGTTVIFDAGLRHEVEEVLSGTRYALVFWLRETDFI